MYVQLLGFLWFSLSSKIHRCMILFQEPVILPAWNTFISSVSGIWKGVGAVFSPITAEMEPIEIGNKNEHLFDCYTLSRIDVEPSSSASQQSLIRRKVNWVTVNPHGEVPESNGGDNRSLEKPTDAASSFHMHDAPDRKLRNLPKFESFDFGKTDIMEEDIMGMEPGLVFFEVKLTWCLWHWFSIVC